MPSRDFLHHDGERQAHADRLRRSGRKAADKDAAWSWCATLGNLPGSENIQKGEGVTRHSRKARKRRTLTAKERGMLVGALIHRGDEKATADQRGIYYALGNELMDATIIIEAPQRNERVSQ